MDHRSQDAAFQAAFRMAQLKENNPSETENEDQKPVKTGLIHRTQFPLKHILVSVSTVSKVSIADIISDRKTWDLVYWRDISSYLMRKHTGASYPKIGMKLGGRDHTTVMHACRKVEKNISKFQDDIAKVEAML